MGWLAEAVIVVSVAVTVYFVVLDPRFEGDQQRRAVVAAGVVMLFPLIPAYWIRRWYGMSEMSLKADGSSRPSKDPDP